MKSPFVLKQFLLIFFLGSFISISRNPVPKYFRIEVNNKYGYIDKLGNEIVKPQFKRAQKYVYGNVFWARDFNQNYLLFNVDGTTISKDTFDHCSKQFTINKWTVKKDDQYGIIDSTGQILVPFEYEKLKTYRDGLIVATKKDKLGYIFEETSEKFIPLPNQENYDYEYLGEFYFSFFDKKENRYGIYNSRTGKIDVKAKHRKIGRVRYQQVLLESFDKGKNKGIGIYDLRLKKFIVPPGEYIDIWIPANVSYLESSAIDQMEEDSLFIGTKSEDGKTLVYYVINSHGKSFKVKGNLAPQGYNFWDSGFFGGIAVFKYKVQNQVKIGIINPKGELLFAPKYDGVFGVSEQMITISKNGLFGYINLSGNEIIEPQFKKAGRFINGITYVKKEILKDHEIIIEEGYINKEGNFVWKKPQ
ncbi:MAG: WG repeat-containing protein [Flavobacteriales bacterium]|nr:WG repeat-containing protein [Flavobacteriales bacterium]